jgi:hypothetical protein
MSATTRVRKVDRGEDLARRREVLLLRSARLRDELREDVSAVRHGLRHVDRGVTFARSGWLMPIAVGVGVALTVARPSRLLRVAGRVLAYGPVLWPVVRPFLPRVLAAIASAMGAGSAAPPRAHAAD